MFRLAPLLVSTCCLLLTACIASADDTSNLRMAESRTLQKDARMTDMAVKAEFSDFLDLFDNFSFGDLLECGTNFPGCLLELTLFAPNDDALFGFDDKLLLLKLTTDADWRPHLLGLLKYHVAFGDVKSNEIEDNGEIKTLLGETVQTSRSNNDVFINDAKVVTPDKETPFGVIHVIDKILRPSFLDNDIVDIVSDNDDFSILKALVVDAGLADDLRGKGPLTVFGPTNEAFEKLGESALADLRKAENKDMLIDILLYHVSASSTTLWDLRTSDEVGTLLKGSTIDVGRGGFFDVELNDKVGIEKSNILARNGILHQIDTVLIPTWEELPSIVDIASSNKDLSTLVTALSKSDLLAPIQGNGPFSVFAPTNSAFAELGSAVDDLLEAENKAALNDILGYHVIAGEVKKDDLTDGSITTINGLDLAVDVRSFLGFFLSATLNDNAKFVAYDIEASNGVIHIIDRVLIPPATPTKSIAEIASETEDLATLVEALKAAELVDTLSDPDGGPYTVFAPTNAAFAALGDDALANLVKPENQNDLVAILTYHVVGGKKVERNDLVDGPIKTLNGATVEVNDKAFFFGFFDMGVQLNGNADIVVFDIPASNGIIHVIDAILSPP